MKKILFLIGTVFLFTSCLNDSQAATQKGDFKVEFLFEQDGCKLYRFKDGTRYIYRSNCQGKIQSDYMSGKNRVKQETIITE